MGNIAFEYLAGALEDTKGTAESAPTFYSNLFGTVTPRRAYYEPNESSGVLAQMMRSKITRHWGEFNAEGPLDVNVLIEFLSMAVKGGVSGSQPGTAADTYEWLFTPSMTSDDIEAATLFFGDPNMSNILRGAYGLISQLRIASDATGTDGATMSIQGVTANPTKQSAPSMPTRDTGELVAGINLSMFLDTSSAIGTTEVTGRVLKAEHTLSTGIEPDWVAVGPDGSITYTGHQRGKAQLVTTFELDFDDYTQFDLVTDTPVKLRIVHNGPFIETDSSIDYYHGVRVDTYGLLRFTGWGDKGGITRTAQFEVRSQYDATLGADYSIQVTNEVDALHS